MTALNYKHLHYFWVVAKDGGIARASERLHLTPQTISGQVSLFEDMLGYKLFTRIGRRFDLTDAGRMVLSYADEIFSLGEELEGVLHDPTGGRPTQFRVGIADAIDQKVMAYRLLEPALRLPVPPRIVCREGKLVSFLQELAVQRLDIVIADSPIPAAVSIKGFSQLLGTWVHVLCHDETSAKIQRTIPELPDGSPLLLPGEDAALRPRLIQWFES